MREPNPTEPANYRGSYTTVFKEIADIDISMYHSSKTVTIDTVTIAPRTYDNLI
jgi:hypothetical protein